MKIIKTIKYNDVNYPNILKYLKDPPMKLYLEGNWDLTTGNNIAVIGSRKCSEYGRRVTRKVIKELMQLDINVISGMAVGIDSEAHEATIKNKGKTIAVLPSGLNNIFPKENIKLYQNIIKSGGLALSEYYPNVKATSKQFIERNRIVSGLAVAVIVIEAGFRSGTSITARLAKEQGKPVFCIPSSIENRKGIGTNILIQKGAIMLTNIKQITDYCPQISIKQNVLEPKREVKKEYYKIYKEIQKGPIDIELLIKRTKMNVKDINFKLTMLELDGVIKQLKDGNFVTEE